MPPRCSSAPILQTSRLLPLRPHRNAATHCFLANKSPRQTPGQPFSQFQTSSIPKSGGSFCQRFQSRHLTSSSTMIQATTSLTLEERLKLFEYDEKTFDDAIHGRKIPLELGFPQMQACIIRGIRHHDNFGTELRGHPEFDRALNARSIMSNRIPEMKRSDEFPYCIWYPDVATEDTYREVAQRYPQMRYQVGRACAVAGYVDLYRELELLPDAAIAEEARDNKQNGTSLEIFKDIMAAPARYAVMNDYTRSVDTDRPQSGVSLNADTAVRSSLKWKRKYPQSDSRDRYPHPRDPYTIPDYTEDPYEPYLATETYWNITEDWNFDDRDSEETQWWPGESPAPDPDPRVPLFYSPLPKDLPNINKDMLIIEAAYSGNIDRYVRLRRPQIVSTLEEECIIRGIYCSTMFAKWWSLQPEILDQNWEFSHPHEGKIQAINARFIMNNNLSRINDETPEDHLPYLIHWPCVASEEIYAELLRRKPCMKQQIARACIVGNYEDLYRSIDVEADQWLETEARESPNPFYLKDLLGKGGDYENNGNEYWTTQPVVEIMKSKLHHIFDLKTMPYSLERLPPLDWSESGCIWNGCEANLRSLEAYVGWTKQKIYGK